MRKLTKSDFVVPALLLGLSVVPSLGGIVRLHSLVANAPATPENTRFLQNPTPVLIHVVAALLYSAIGAFQFSGGLRARWPHYHRVAGRVGVVLGLLAAISGLWMTLVYQIPQPMQGPSLYWVRLAVGSAMIGAIMMGIRSIIVRDFKGHEAYMIRAYALGQGAGTQAVIMLPWMLITGNSVGPTRDFLMVLSWIVNVVIAEWIIRRKRAPKNNTKMVAMDSLSY